MAIDLEPESLVIGKVPVKAVQFQKRHDVEQAFDCVGLVEMAGAIQMLSAPVETGLIGYGATRHFAGVDGAQHQ